MFIETKASKQSLARRKLICGVGVNDADYNVSQTKKGVTIHCPFYLKWLSMIRRCYSKKYQDKFTSYIGCSVYKEWFVFSNFKKWMIDQDWKDKHLDKDILVQGNKIYSPETCIFVCERINYLIIENKSSRGEYFQGVHKHCSTGKFQANCNDGVKKVFLGSFDSEIEAHDAYSIFKKDLIDKVAIEQLEPLRTALLNYKVER